MIIAGTVGRECKCCLIKFALRSKIERDSGAYQENQSRDRAGKLTFSEVIRMKWKGIKVEIVGRTDDGRFLIIKLLEPMYKYDKIVYDIGTEIVVVDNELN